MIPNAHHGYGEASQYMMRRRWDYFVKNLVNGTPPSNYQMRSWDDATRTLWEYGPAAGLE